jgi:hypothetical protein
VPSAYSKHKKWVDDMFANDQGERLQPLPPDCHIGYEGTKPRWMVWIKCKGCGIEFEARKDRAAKGIIKYCSITCKNEDARHGPPLRPWYRVVKVEGRQTREHTLVAEAALGKRLCSPHEVHHFTPSELVICQDRAYHMLLHVRQRAYEATGDPHKRKCSLCKQWDDPQNMRSTRGRSDMFHDKCLPRLRRYTPKHKQSHS